MLSKEEIECCKQEAKNYIKFMECKDNCGWLRGLLWHIEQLETNNKKLIEKLEEDIYYANDNIKNIDESNIAQVITKEIKISIRDYVQEILKIAKGEKE